MAGLPRFAVLVWPIILYESYADGEGRSKPLTRIGKHRLGCVKGLIISPRRR